MTLEWGFSTLGCAEMGLLDAAALANEFGFRAIEVRFLDGEEDMNASLSRFLATPGQAEKLFNSGVILSCLNTSCELDSASAEELQTLKESALLADRLGAKYLRVFDGAEFGEPFTPERKEKAAANFREWRRWRQENGVKAALALETHGATASSARTLELFAVLGERLPVIWDTHHTLILAGEKPEETWRLLGDSIVEAHFKDSVALPSDRHPYTYVLPGQGRMPVRETLALLERNGFGGFAVLEWERKWFPELPELREAMAATVTAGWRGRADGPTR